MRLIIRDAFAHPLKKSEIKKDDRGHIVIN